jgi:hypothetical protein
MAPNESALVAGAKHVIRQRRDEARSLPHPDETFVVNETKCGRGDIEAFHQVDIVEKVGRVRHESDQSRYLIKQWRTTPEAWDAIQSLDDPATPCGHPGIQNLRNGRYSCAKAECDAEFSKEVARAEVNR